MEKTSNINVRINKELKKKAEEVVESLGLTLSSAINMYLMQIVLTKSIPFEISISNEIPNKETVKALKEGEKIIKNPKKYKSYTLEEFKMFLMDDDK